MGALMRLTPCFKDYIWGGDKLKRDFGKVSDLSIIAESWELSVHPNGKCVVENGVNKGKSLDEIGLDIPILIKLIDATDNLSVQVHPDDTYAAANENGSMGKTEVWYIVDAEQGAELVYGFNADVTKQQFANAIKNDALSEILNFVPVKKGDVFFIPAGMVHAIGKGILICEIQQNSDTTYRVYDWGRKNPDGTTRPLHIEKALEVSTLSQQPNSEFALKMNECNGNKCGVIAECDYFNAYKYEVEDKIKLTAKGFNAVTFLDGNGTISTNETKEEFSKGVTFFVDKSTEFEIIGKCEFIISCQ